MKTRFPLMMPLLQNLRKVGKAHFDQCDPLDNHFDYIIVIISLSYLFSFVVLPHLPPAQHLLIGLIMKITNSGELHFSKKSFNVFLFNNVLLIVWGGCSNLCFLFLCPPPILKLFASLISIHFLRTCYMINSLLGPSYTKVLDFKYFLISQKEKKRIKRINQRAIMKQRKI